MMFWVLIGFIVVAAGVAWFLLSRDRGAKEPVGGLWAAAGFGLLAMIAALVVESFVIPADPAKLGFLVALLATLGVGFIEEIAKFVPLAAWLWRKPFFNEHTDGIIYFTLAGLTFGVLEDFMYTFGYGAGAGAFRLILVPFFHGASTGIVGFFLARAKIAAKPASSIWWALLLMGLLHGLYDFGLTVNIVTLMVVSVMLSLLMGIGLFLYYMKAGELDQDAGLSTVGKNNFCRSCGQANPGHMLYCETCGQPA